MDGVGLGKAAILDLRGFGKAEILGILLCFAAEIESESQQPFTLCGADILSLFPVDFRCCVWVVQSSICAVRCLERGCSQRSRTGRALTRPQRETLLAGPTDN